MNKQMMVIMDEMKKAVSGKDNVIWQVLTAILAGGHILLEDIPGVGKTTLALALSRALGLSFQRVQFTPDVVPSDITGFSVYDKARGQFTFRKGAVMTNFFLADEINRTSSKTQSALLQVMQEGQVTVDGKTYEMPRPFVVLATQNPVGTAGTQMLPEAQLDRFMIKITMGYPDIAAQIEILKNRETQDPLELVEAKTTAEELLGMKEEIKRIYVDEKIYQYIINLAEASRHHEQVRLGISPRGTLALSGMAKARAFIQDRDFVTPEDVQAVFHDTCRHRLILHPKAGVSHITSDDILNEILEKEKAPKTD
ncbi:MAG: MoxR family ATPase [Parasporobacterium sp.]|nr:MoxR family ATPase [Parasporobacterium sp.]